MPFSSVDKRKQLIRPWSLSLIAIAILGVLVLLMPKNSFLTNPDLISKPNTLSVAYLKALLKADSGNDEIRLLYAEHLAEMGKVDEASEQLKALDMGQHATLPRVVFLDLRVAALKQLREPKNKDLRQQIEHALAVGKALPIDTFSVGQWKRLADLMLQGGQADLAADVYLRLAIQDSKNKADWLRKSAKWFLASGNSQRAAAVQLKLALLTGELEDSKASVKYLLAANEPVKMMRVISKMIAKFPEDRTLLKDGMQTALSTRQEAKGIAWGDDWLRHHAMDKEIIQLLISLELEAGQPAKAYAWAEKLSRMEPENVAWHRQLANVAQWSGHSAEAYRQWKWVLQHEPSQHALIQTMFFANQMRDYPNAKALLLRAKVKYGMTTQTLSKLVWLQEKLGQPEDSEKTRMAYLRQSPHDQAAWQGLAILREYLGKVEASENTWHNIEQRFGASAMSRIHRAKMLVAMHRANDAIVLMRSYAQKHQVSSVQFWKVYGDIAWNLEYHDDAYQAYIWLWEHDQPGSFEVQRLMMLLREEGDVEATLKISKQAWQRFKDPDILLLAIESAVSVSRWNDVEQLMGFAASQMSLFRRNARYWLAHARWMQHENKLKLVEDDFFRVLHLTPENKEARVGLLWSWIQAADRKSLLYYLKLWQHDALGDKEYWQVYAAAYRSMRLYKAALFWFKKTIPLKGNDILWMLEYADTLGAAGHASGAWRLRQYLFVKMWPKSRLSTTYAKQNNMAMLEAQVWLKKRLLGLAHAQFWVEPFIKHANDPIVREFAMRWYFGIGAESQASFWLMRQHAARLAVPAWEDLAQAMGRNDLDSIYRILSTRSSEIDHVSRMLATRQLGLLDDAWELAMDTRLGTHRFNAVERTTMLRHTRNIAEETPNAGHITLKMDALSSLGMTRTEARAYRSRDNHTMALKMGMTSLKPAADLGDLKGHNQEYKVRLESVYRKPRGDTFAYIGLNSRNNLPLDGGRFVQWGAGLHWRPWQGGEFGLALDANQVDVDTSAFRLVGMKDVLKLSFNTDFTSREYLASSLKLNRYQTRNHEPIARGYTLEATLGERLGLASSLAEEQMQIRLTGLMMRNRLQPTLGKFAQTILVSDSVEAVIPQTFSSLGLSFNLQKDILDNKAAIGRSPLYLFDAGLGWQWPTSTPTYNLSLGVGLPVFGRDLFSVSTYVANTVGVNGQNTYGLMFTYGSRFSR